MSAWDEYLRLLTELDALGSEEAAGIAEANATFQRLVRELDHEQARASRELQTLRSQNSELQAGTRSLCRSLGVEQREDGLVQPMRRADIAEAVRSAKYDVEQLRASLQSIEQTSMRAAPQAAPPIMPQVVASSPLPAAPPAPRLEPAPPVTEATPSRLDPRQVRIAVRIAVSAAVALAVLQILL